VHTVSRVVEKILDDRVVVSSLSSVVFFRARLYAISVYNAYCLSVCFIIRLRDFHVSYKSVHGNVCVK